MTKFGAVSLLDWGIFRRGNPRWSGERLFMEAERVARQFEIEVARQHPDHEINWHDVILELRVTYLVSDAAD